MQSLAQIKTPLDFLLPYQRKWVLDKSRFKMWLASRQIGKSFGATFEVVMDSWQYPNSNWILVSATEKQAQELLSKCLKWSRTFEAFCSGNKALQTSFTATCDTISFSNGSKIFSLSSNPAGLRSWSGSIVLDEMCFLPHDREIWQSLLPVITNEISGQKKVRLISTASGKNNTFYELYSDSRNAYSKHRTTITEAQGQGLKVDTAAIKEALGDADIYACEYMCEWMDASNVLLPYELIEATETDIVPSNNIAPLYAGIDIGRSHDLTVISIGQVVDGVLNLIDMVELKNEPFDNQLKIISAKINNNRFSRVCVDATGLGMMLSESLAKRFGYVESVTFTHAIKNEIYTELRTRFERQSIRIPRNRDLREDLHSVNRLVSSSGQISYSATRNSDGHADRACSIALLCRAVQSGESTSFFMPIAFKR